MLCFQKDCHYYCGGLFAEIPPESLKSDNERASREGWDHVTRLNIYTESLSFHVLLASRSSCGHFFSQLRRTDKARKGLLVVYIGKCVGVSLSQKNGWPYRRGDLKLGFHSPFVIKKNCKRQSINAQLLPFMPMGMTTSAICVSFASA